MTEEVFILCPPNYMTGGPEALHQLCARLTKIGRKARMVYSNGQDYSIMMSPTGDRVIIFPDYEDPVHPHYKAYSTEHCDCITDIESALIVFPEIWPHLIPLFKRAQKAFWWLSFDYGMRALSPLGGLQFLASQNCIMLSQSAYASAQLSAMGHGDVPRVSDFIRLAEQVDLKSPSERADLILYNNKAEDFGRQLATLRPQYEFKLLANMSSGEVHQLMGQAKLYLDFGPHAGKDRMPREAALLGCCILTGRDGSANNFEDLPIASKYKFGNHHLRMHEIADGVDDILGNYTRRFAEFDYYRRIIATEEVRFELEVFSVFGTI